MTVEEAKGPDRGPFIWDEGRDGEGVVLPLPGTRGLAEHWIPSGLRLQPYLVTSREHGKEGELWAVGVISGVRDHAAFTDRAL